MNEMLKNHCLVRILCQEYEQGRSITSPSTGNGKLKTKKKHTKS